MLTPGVCANVVQVDRVYVSSPNVIAVLDHEKKRTFVIRKDGLPDTGKTHILPSIHFPLSVQRSQPWWYMIVTQSAISFLLLAVVWNPWEKKAKTMADFGDEEYKQTLCVDAAAAERPITLRPGEEWTGRLELSAVPSTNCSDHLDQPGIM